MPTDHQTGDSTADEYCDRDGLLVPPEAMSLFDVQQRHARIPSGLVRPRQRRGLVIMLGMAVVMLLNVWAFLRLQGMQATAGAVPGQPTVVAMAWFADGELATAWNVRNATLSNDTLRFDLVRAQPAEAQWSFPIVTAIDGAASIRDFDLDGRGQAAIAFAARAPRSFGLVIMRTCKSCAARLPTG